MDLIETVPILIAGVFPPAMADRPMIEAPLGQAMVNIILIGIDPGPRGDKLLDQRLDRGLSDVLQQPDHHGATALDHPEDRRFFVLQGAAPARALQAAASPPAAFFLTASGCPL